LSRPSRPLPTCSRTASPGGWPSTSVSRWEARCTYWESMGSASSSGTKPRLWPRRSTTGAGWHGC
jgi:hypothetical protein